jgi:EamA domain-containing membrane protein RarD
MKSKHKKCECEECRKKGLFVRPTFYFLLGVVSTVGGFFGVLNGNDTTVGFMFVFTGLIMISVSGIMEHIEEVAEVYKK